MASDLERFEAKVTKTGTCWLWGACVRSDGYGWFSVGGRSMAAHRYAYEQYVGPIPDGMALDHLCRVRRCVNPRHLEAVTDRVNILRGRGRAAENAKKTHCGNGHPLSGDNLKPWHLQRGKRKCRACSNARDRRYRAARKQEAP